MRFLLFLVLMGAVVVAVKRLLPRTPTPEPDAPDPKPEPEPLDVMAELRARVLRGTAEQFGVEPLHGVWGVLMETGYAEAAVTLVALADGSASLYFSSGGGIVGGGPNPSVHAAARCLVEMATEHASELRHTEVFPLPDTGQVRFYVLTTRGVVEGSSREEALHSGSHPLSDLFFGGHDVLTRLREVSEERVLH